MGYTVWITISVWAVIITIIFSKLLKNEFGLSSGELLESQLDNEFVENNHGDNYCFVMDQFDKDEHENYH